MSASHADRYEATRFDDRRTRAYAVKVANALTARGVPQRSPRPETTAERVISTGPFGLKKKTVVERRGGGTPTFWLVCAHRVDGTMHHTPSSGLYTRVHGEAILLTAQGELLSANYEAEISRSGLAGPFFTDIRPASVDRLLFADRSDRGRWVVESHGRDYRERFDRHFALTAHAKGVGISVALKRLLDGGEPNWNLAYHG